jgi:blue light- and temperature-responsive anti-repressor
MTALHRLVYVSHSRLEGTPAEREAQVRCILAGSRERNLGGGLTGALLFNDDCFAQTLEGTFDSVSRTFERIQRDERHHDVTVLSLDKTEERAFPSWSMAYVGAANFPAAAHARLRLRPLFLSRTSEDGQNVLALLRQAIGSEKAASA